MKKRYLILFIFLFISISISISCDRRIDMLDIYISDIQKYFTSNEINKLKTKQGDELVEYIVFDIGKKLSQKRGIDSIPLVPLGDTQLIDSILISNELTDHKLASMFMLFHYRLNDLELDYHKIDSIVNSYYDKLYKNNGPLNSDIFRIFQRLI